MEFDNRHKVADIEKLTLIQAEEYIEFLNKERERHEEVYARCDTRARLWTSEAVRQSEEIEKIDIRLNKLRELFEL